MDDSKKSTQEKEDLGERGAPRKGDREAQSGEGKGETDFVSLLQSLDLERKPRVKEGLLTMEGLLDGK